MPGSKTATVIIVEDDSSMCQALTRLLRLGEFAPVMYGSAEACLDQKWRDDAICMILDVQLPGIDGLTLHERLSALRAVPPAIFITAFDEPEVRARAARTGSVFLAKPFSGRVLLETIRNLRRTSGLDTGPPLLPD